MNFLHSISVLLPWIIGFVNGLSLTDVTYEELEQLGASCGTLDNCKLQRDKDTLSLYTCHCSSFCPKFGTCCVDSAYRYNQSEILQPSCKDVHGTHASSYFIEDTCKTDSNADVIWEKYCKVNDQTDLLSLVPVTSLATNKTYKNYFCFRCNENGHRYRYWNVKIFAGVKPDENREINTILTYNSLNQTWVANIGKNGSVVPVTFSVEASHDIYDLPKLCIPGVISICSDDWKDDIMDKKCRAYTSIVHFVKDEGTFSYRNPHCALCNFENLENMLCALGITGRKESKMPFSFALLLDINPSDGEFVGKRRKCGKNAMWDPHYKKCRNLTCAVPGYVIQNGQCVPP